MHSCTSQGSPPLSNLPAFPTGRLFTLFFSILPILMPHLGATLVCPRLATPSRESSPTPLQSAIPALPGRLCPCHPHSRLPIRRRPGRHSRYPSRRQGIRDAVTDADGFRSGQSRTSAGTWQLHLLCLHFVGGSRGSCRPGSFFDGASAVDPTFHESKHQAPRSSFFILSRISSIDENLVYFSESGSPESGFNSSGR